MKSFLLMLVFGLTLTPAFGQEKEDPFLRDALTLSTLTQQQRSREVLDIGLPMLRRIETAGQRSDSSAALMIRFYVASALSMLQRNPEAMVEFGKVAEFGLPKIRSMEAAGTDHTNQELLAIRFAVGSSLALLHREREGEEELRIVVHDAPSAGLAQLAPMALSILANITVSSGRIVEAFELSNSALRLARTYPDLQPALIPVILFTADADGQMGRSTEALVLMDEARAILTERKDAGALEQEFHLTFSEEILYARVGDDRRVGEALDRMDKLASTPNQRVQVQNARRAIRWQQALQDGNFPLALKVRQELTDSTYADDAESIMDKAIDATIQGKIYFASHDFEHTRVELLRSIEFFQQAFDQLRTTNTEVERNQFRSEIQGTLDLFLSFCFLNRISHPELLPDAYRVVLWSKEIAKETSGANAIDPLAVKDQATLQRLRVELSEGMRASPGSPADQKLQEEIEVLERKLAVSSTAAPKDVTAAQIAAVLAESDAAVEVFTYDEWDEGGPTFATLYAAFVLGPSKTHPLTMVKLGEDRDIEVGEVDLKNRVRGPLAVRAIRPEVEQTLPNSLSWSKLEPYVRTAHRIYLAPTGALDTAAFFCWKGSDGRFLLDHDEWDIRAVFSTADLAYHKNTTVDVSKRDAVLIGNPDFNAGDDRSQSKPGAGASDEPRQNVPPLEMRTALGNTVLPLPNTPTELANIYAVLRHHGWNVASPLENAAASKTTFLAVHHPFVLHVATHGFFAADPGLEGLDLTETGRSFSLGNSGLLLASANLTLQGHRRAAGDDGILTAFDIAGMDLRGTDLVVLSACDTGLGEAGAGGNLRGLRSSFIAAGADAVMVSMWNVNDPATARMMSSFYNYWLNSESGDRYAALRAAAKELHQDPNYDRPFYWAAFVLFTSYGK